MMWQQRQGYDRDGGGGGGGGMTTKHFDLTSPHADDPEALMQLYRGASPFEALASPPMPRGQHHAVPVPRSQSPPPPAYAPPAPGW